MKTNYEVRYAAHPQDAKGYDTTRIRRDFLIEKVFAADGETVAIAVKKKADVKNPESECDAVTGATLTSDGVSLMLQESFAKYKSFLKK